MRFLSVIQRSLFDSCCVQQRSGIIRCSGMKATLLRSTASPTDPKKLNKFQLNYEITTGEAQVNPATRYCDLRISRRMDQSAHEILANATSSEFSSLKWQISQSNSSPWLGMNFLRLTISPANQDRNPRTVSAKNVSATSAEQS